jgi:hypothetical protein
MIFFLMLTLRYRQADFVAIISSPVPLTLAINYCKCKCCFYRRYIKAGVVVTSDKVITGIMESMKIRNKAYSLVSTTPAIIYPAGSNDTGDNISPVLLAMVNTKL